MPCILVNQYANQKFITLLHNSPELSEQIVKLHAEAIELRKADQAAVRRYFNYRSSRGIAMNIIFTMSVMKREEETLAFLKSFFSRLDLAM